MKIVMLILLGFFVLHGYGQDSTSAIYISDLVQAIEARLAKDIMEKKDTLIYDHVDSGGKAPTLIIQTEFYTNPQTMLLDKIVEKSVYKKCSTELVIYFFGNQPVRFTNRQWDNQVRKIDFDIYYMNGQTVYTVNRSQSSGMPDGGTYLKWCYELRSEYLRMAEDYNQTFASRKAQGRLK